MQDIYHGQSATSILIMIHTVKYLQKGQKLNLLLNTEPDHEDTVIGYCYHMDLLLRLRYKLYGDV